MMHVKKIKELVENGAKNEAKNEIENLLALGPQNLEALKLKAYILEGEGHFQEAAREWHKIIEIDNEDEDALNYLQTRQIEEKERFYFTDELPEGGRRFLAYPKAIITISMWGLIGCIFFLFAIRYAEYNKIAYSNAVLLAGFFLFIIMPWVGIGTVYFRSLTAPTLSPKGVAVSTRFKTFQFGWDELSSVSIAHKIDLQEAILKLALIPKSPDLRPVVIDLSEDSSPLKARSTIVPEILRYYKDISYEELQNINFGAKKPLKF